MRVGCVLLPFRLWKVTLFVAVLVLSLHLSAPAVKVIRTLFIYTRMYTYTYTYTCVLSLFALFCLYRLFRLVDSNGSATCGCRKNFYGCPSLSFSPSVTLALFTFARTVINAPALELSARTYQNYNLFLTMQNFLFFGQVITFWHFMGFIELARFGCNCCTFWLAPNVKLSKQIANWFFGPRNGALN